MEEKTKTEADAKKELAALNELVQRAQGGDASVLPQLKVALDDHPEIWQSFGDMVVQTEAVLINLAAGKNLLLAESLRRQFALQRAELCGDAPTPVERLMVAQVVLATAEVNYQSALMTQCGDDDVRAKVIERRQDAAQRRHMAAINLLTTIQKRRPPDRSRAKTAKGGAGPTAPEKSEGVVGTVPSSD
jgi:hypothetical protein